jgi:hypothetical protein
MNPPPLPSKKKSHNWIIFIVLGIVIVGGLLFGLFQLVSGSGFAKMADQQFGDQHLKTAVALIELHKVRVGRYPEDLSKLRFTGQWDMLAVQSVRYIAASDGSSYFVDVQRGWIGKPQLVLPEEFWHGTGFNPELAQSK